MSLTRRQNDSMWSGHSVTGFGSRSDPTTLALLAALLFCLAPPARAADTLWEYTPYRVQIMVAMDRDPALTPALLDDLQRELSQRAESVVGSPWNAAVMAAPANVAHAVRWRLEGLTFDELPRTELEMDKVLFVHVAQTPMGYRVAARDLDVRTRQFSPIVTRDVPQRPMLVTAAFETVLEAFAPLAQVESVERRSAGIRLKAASLTPRDPSIDTLTKGQVFRPITRANNADGSVRGVRAIPWTYLSADTRDGALVNCRIHTGLRSPLSSRRRGRVEQLCLSVRPPQRPTRVELFSLTDTRYPLAGYEVYVYGPNSKATSLLGHTDRLGAINVPPSEGHPLRLLLVKNGGEPLAKLPIVPGVEPTTSALITNDEQRLRVEGFISGMQERIVDVVASRHLLMARIRLRIKSGNIKHAEALLTRLQALPTLVDFREELTEFQRGVATNDSRVKRKIDKLFGDTRKVMETQLGPKPITDLALQVQTAKVASQ